MRTIVTTNHLVDAAERCARRRTFLAEVCALTDT
jgi:hypothetical protein